MGVRIHLVCNASSGSGTDVDAIRRSLERHGANLVDEEEAAERIVVAGGDGTVGEGADLAARLGVPLAVVPTGTANDFARTTGLPDDLDAALELAATGARTRSLELGRADGRPFVNTASTGLAPSAARRAEPLKRLLGPFAYPLGALAAGALDKPVRCRVGSLFEGEAWQVILACSGAFGGGTEIEAADPGDGRLDVLVLPAGPRLALARKAVAMRRGTLAETPGVLHDRVGALTVTVPPDTRFNVDGEVTTFGGDVRFSAHAGAVLLVAP
jgi:diacylglycerol kinase (ATP)